MMAGNSKRRGAIKRTGKGPTVGSGGVRRRALEAKGPTPKAKDRPGHKAYRLAKSADKRGSTSRSSGTGRHTRSRAGAESSEWLAGRNPVVEALRAEIPAEALYVQNGIDADERTREALQLAADRGLAILEVTKREIDRWVAGATHQGIALKVPPYNYSDPLDVINDAIAGDAAPLLVALDGVTDPRNLGACLRVADGAGVDAVIAPKDHSCPLNETAIQTASGAAETVPYVMVTNLSRTIDLLEDRDVRVIGTADGVAQSIYDVEIPPAVAWVLGAEGVGLRRLTRERCDVLASIPMAGQVSSLNVSVAAGVVLYETVRRTRMAPPRP
jgi:23S rRNA (guanosine2251-2'-O)-methyltransferase